jgi:DNA-binding transcriptional ArsR family regulator
MPRADLIIHPVRLRIIQQFGPRERVTAQHLAIQLPDVSHATLYRHLAALVRGGVLAVVDVRPVRAAQEKLYALVEGAANVGPTDYDGEAPDDHLRHFTAFLGLLRGDFERYVRGRDRPNLATDGVAYYQIPLYLSDAERDRLVQDLKALLGPLRQNRPDGSRTRRLVTVITVPGTAVVSDGARSRSAHG